MEVITSDSPMNKKTNRNRIRPNTETFAERPDDTKAFEQVWGNTYKLNHHSQTKRTEPPKPAQHHIVMYTDSIADHEVYENSRMMDYVEADTEDTEQAIIEFNADTEDELQELASVAGPDDKKDRNHGVTSR